MNTKIYKHLAVLLCFLALAFSTQACKSKTKPRPEIPDPDPNNEENSGWPVYPKDLFSIDSAEVDKIENEEFKNAVSDLQAAIVEGKTSTQDFFDLVSRAFFLQHHLNHQKRFRATETPEQVWDEIMKSQSFSASEEKLEDLKIKLLDETYPDMKYNKAHHLVSSLVIDNRRQCYSGTSYLELGYRNVFSPEKYYARNMLVVFSPGHIFSGYTVKNDKVWTLYGIETTVRGKGSISLGELSQLHEKSDYGFRVVDAQLWMIYSVLEPFLLQESKFETKKKVLAWTDDKFDGQIPLDELEKKIGDKQLEIIDEISEKGADQGLEGAYDPLAFGASKVRPGDQDMDEKDQVGIPKGVYQGVGLTPYIPPTPYFGTNDSNIDCIKKAIEKAICEGRAKRFYEEVEVDRQYEHLANLIQEFKFAVFPNDRDAMQVFFLLKDRPGEDFNMTQEKSRLEYHIFLYANDSCTRRSDNNLFSYFGPSSTIYSLMENVTQHTIECTSDAWGLDDE
ncbi:MAG: hypothetical protein KDD52_04905 [Bdellovibrionales bacterium]|nr:hypothetical protein [Bdellovibrionales bacterium]